MKAPLIALLIALWFIIANAPESWAKTAKPKEQPPLPAEVSTWIDRSHRCWKSKGWTPEMNQFRCSDLENDERKIRIKYKSNTEVIQAIDEIVDKYHDVE